MPDICLRTVEFRATDESSDGRTLEGYGAVFDVPTRIHSWEGEFDERIQRGAFARTIRRRTPVLQFDHGRDARTGTVPIGAVEALSEDEQGLFVSARLFDNPVVEPIRQAIEGRSITGMSIRFSVAADEWTDNQGVRVKAGELQDLLWNPGERGPLLRTITRIDPLYELGPVVFPAYETTSVGVRSLLDRLDADERKDLIRELAAELRRHPALTDLIAASSARSTDGDEPDDVERQAAEASPVNDKHARARTLQLLGVTNA